MTASPPRRSSQEQAKLDAALCTLQETSITFNQTLGVKVLSTKLGDVRAEFAMKPMFVGHYLYGRLHGGVIASVLDTMGGFALMVSMGEAHPHETAEQVLHRFARMGTIDLRVDYLSPGVGKVFTATAETTRLGGRIGSAQMRLHNDEGKLVATACGAYVVS